MLINVQNNAVPIPTELAQFSKEVIQYLKNQDHIWPKSLELFAEVSFMGSFEQQALNREPEQIFPSEQSELLYQTIDISDHTIRYDATNDRLQSCSTNNQPRRRLPSVLVTNPVTTPGTSPLTPPVTNPATTPSTMPITNPVTIPVITPTNPITVSPTVPGQSWCWRCRLLCYPTEWCLLLSKCSRESFILCFQQLLPEKSSSNQLQFWRNSNNCQYRSKFKTMYLSISKPHHQQQPHHRYQP